MIRSVGPLQQDFNLEWPNSYMLVIFTKCRKYMFVYMYSINMRTLAYSCHPIHLTCRMPFEQSEGRKSLRESGEGSRRRRQRRSESGNLQCMYIGFLNASSKNLMLASLPPSLPPPLPPSLPLSLPPRADTEHMLIEARQNQVRNKEHFLAVQAQRDRTEFERVL